MASGHGALCTFNGGFLRALVGLIGVHLGRENWSSIYFRKKQDYGSKQRRDLMAHDIPNNRIIDGKVGMGQDIPETGNTFPGDSRAAFSQILWHAFDRFANNFKVMQNRNRGFASSR
jgi:hypothetical protein